MLRLKTDAPLPRFSAPIGIVTACLAITLSVWLLSNSSSQELLQVALVGSLGIVIFLFPGQPQRTDVNYPTKGSDSIVSGERS